MMGNKVKPTKLQRKAIEIKIANPDMPLGRAMIEAGYSKVSASHPKQNIIESEGFQSLIEEYQQELIGQGLTKFYVAKKIKEFTEAKKPFSSHTEPDRMIEDWQTQIKGVEMLRDDLGLAAPKGNLTQINIEQEKIQRYRDFVEYELSYYSDDHPEDNASALTFDEWLASKKQLPLKGEENA